MFGAAISGRGHTCFGHTVSRVVNVEPLGVTNGEAIDKFIGITRRRLQADVVTRQSVGITDGPGSIAYLFVNGIEMIIHEIDAAGYDIGRRIKSDIEWKSSCQCL